MAYKLPLRGRAFIDTNLLVYADARDEPVKQRVALDVLKALYEGGNGVLSTQVLQEYCNVALKKLKLPPQQIRAQLDMYTTFEVVQITPNLIRAGLDLQQIRRIGFYDAIILSSAQTAGCSMLFTEDMAAGESVSGVRIVNPFAAQ